MSYHNRSLKLVDLIISDKATSEEEKIKIVNNLRDTIQKDLSYSGNNIPVFLGNLKAEVEGVKSDLQLD